MRVTGLLTGAAFWLLVPGAVWAAGDQPSSTTRVKPAPAQEIQTIERYRAAVHQAETHHGVYDRHVGEQLLGLGIAYAARGRHREAVKALKRAMYIVRINDGLHTRMQLPILEIIISQNEALKNWDALDRNYDYLYWVERRNYGDDDVRLLPVLERIGHWKLRAYAAQAGPTPRKYLRDAGRLFADAVDMAEKNYGADNPRLIAPLYGVAVANYELSSFYANLDLQAGSGMDAGFDAYPGETREHAYEAERERQMAMMISYSRGAKAMQRALDIYEKNPGLPAEARALALAHAGDWYLVENRPGDARDAYTMAYSVLRKSGAGGDKLDKTFGRPHALSSAELLSPLPLELTPDPPAGTPAKTAQPSKASHGKNYVITMFDVSAKGRPHNVRAVESVPAGDDHMRRRALAFVSATMFRPRIEESGPVETADYKFRVYFDE